MLWEQKMKTVSKCWTSERKYWTRTDPLLTNGQVSVIKRATGLGACWYHERGYKSVQKVLTPKIFHMFKLKGSKSMWYEWGVFHETACLDSLKREITRCCLRQKEMMSQEDELKNQKLKDNFKIIWKIYVWTPVSDIAEEAWHCDTVH